MKAMQCADEYADPTQASIQARFAITMCLLWDSSDGSICTLKVLDCFDLLADRNAMWHLEPINYLIQYHTEQNNWGHYGFLSKHYRSHKAHERQHYSNIISPNKTKTARSLKMFVHANECACCAVPFPNFLLQHQQTDSWWRGR